jgi:EAL domain-containing protein (putative c-di-GMP-specific phosphodiesterase class I)
MTLSAQLDSTDDLDLLRRCTTDGSLVLLYQPEVDLRTGAIVAMEGLLRWQHPTRGLLGPRMFFDLAAAAGELGRIGQWVLREGIAEAVRWSSLDGPVRRLWLNVSAAELAAPGFVPLVAGLIEDSGLPEGAVGLEFSEECVMGLGPAAEPLLEELRRAGVALAVDDFSSWYATVGAVQALPLDVVKLCPGYVRGIGTLAGERIVSAVIGRAHAHGLSVVAEGVETTSEVERLAELGCDRAHGWLYGSAQRADKARWLLTQSAGSQRATVAVPGITGSGITGSSSTVPDAVVPDAAVPVRRIRVAVALPAPRPTSDQLAPLPER